MASWMVHFRLAEMLMRRIEGLHMRAFALGNIAPDSGIPSEDWSSFEPPKEVTHFQRAGLIHDLDFFRGYLRDASPAQDPERYAFLLGYFFHLVTDNFWNVDIWQPSKKRYADQLAADPEFIWEIKKDWYGLDFFYLRDRPDMPIWADFVQIDSAPDYLDFLPVEGLRRSITHIQTFYARAFDAADERAQAAMQRAFEYLSPAEVDRFVSHTAERLCCIYDVLYAERIDVGDAPSAIGLLANPKDTAHS